MKFKFFLLSKSKEKTFSFAFKKDPKKIDLSSQKKNFFAD